MYKHKYDKYKSKYLAYKENFSGGGYDRDDLLIKLNSLHSSYGRSDQSIRSILYNSIMNKLGDTNYKDKDLKNDIDKLRGYLTVDDKNKINLLEKPKINKKKSIP